jgi:hypothetical protein
MGDSNKSAASGSSADKSVQVKLVLLGKKSSKLLAIGLSKSSTRCAFSSDCPRNRLLIMLCLQNIPYAMNLDAYELCLQEKLRSANHPSSFVLCVLNYLTARCEAEIRLRQVSNEFQANKEPTIGAAFLTQKCRLEDRVLRYEIWDTAGQERFHSLAVSLPLCRMECI